MTTALVGGTMVGLDNSSNPFARTITKYLSSTSFEISSALVASGAGTNGYIIPPTSNTYTVTRGTLIDLPDKYIPLVAMDLLAKVTQYKSGGAPDVASIAANDQAIKAAYQGFANERAA